DTAEGTRPIVSSGRPRVGDLDHGRRVDRPARIESEQQPAGDLDRIVGPEAEQASEVFVDVALDERQRTRGDEPGDDGREDIVAQRTRLADDLPRADLDDGQGQSGTGRLGTEPTRGAGVRL